MYSIIFNLLGENEHHLIGSEEDVKFIWNIIMSKYKKPTDPLSKDLKDQLEKEDKGKYLVNAKILFPNGLIDKNYFYEPYLPIFW